MNWCAVGGGWRPPAGAARCRTSPFRHAARRRRSNELATSERDYLLVADTQQPAAGASPRHECEWRQFMHSANYSHFFQHFFFPLPAPHHMP